jgi:ABC-type phosphate/phosphonate transport system substrate-binding protein
MTRLLGRLIGAAALLVFLLPPNAALALENKPPLIMVVMDPLAAPLSCPCVKGYAQRDYEKLARFLEAKLRRPVQVHFSESLPAALAKKTEGKADLVIGKDSVVRAEARGAGLSLVGLADLTDKEGLPTQTGLVVVAAGDPALTINDLGGHRVIFGPGECEEKHGAALRLFKELGVATPEKPETCASCTDGATKVIELHKSGMRVATVISSYAKPLLEGCGTIKKGDLRVVGETDPVPFVRAFVHEKLPMAERDAIQAALFEVARSADLCNALETKRGFVKPDGLKKK